MAYFNLPTFILLLAASSFAYAQDKCPFNKDCQCTKSERNVQYEFAMVVCKQSNLPIFDPNPQIKYSVTGMFFIYADVSSIPANHFQAFGSIKGLTLEHTRQDKKKPSWDTKAFDGPQINTLYVSGLNDMMPLPEAVKNIKSLTILDLDAGSPIALQANAFDSLPNLEQFGVYRNSITKIDPNAFVGAEKLRSFIGDLVTNENLQDLKLALSKAKKLNRFYFTVTETTYVDLAVFSDSTSVNLDILFFNVKQNLTTANPKKFQPNSFVQLSNSRLTTVDESIGDLLSNVRDLTIDIKDAILDYCSKVKWMTKLECPKRMRINGVQCRDENEYFVRLADYLAKIDPTTKCREN